MYKFSFVIHTNQNIEEGSKKQIGNTIKDDGLFGKIIFSPHDSNRIECIQIELQTTLQMKNQNNTSDLDMQHKLEECMLKIVCQPFVEIIKDWHSVSYETNPQLFIRSPGYEIERFSKDTYPHIQSLSDTDKVYGLLAEATDKSYWKMQTAQKIFKAADWENKKKWQHETFINVKTKSKDLSKLDLTTEDDGAIGSPSSTQKDVSLEVKGVASTISMKSKSSTSSAKSVKRETNYYSDQKSVNIGDSVSKATQELSTSSSLVKEVSNKLEELQKLNSSQIEEVRKEVQEMREELQKQFSNKIDLNSSQIEEVRKEVQEMKKEVRKEVQEMKKEVKEMIQTLLNTFK
ncbi:hypothetical protein C9374_012014 [Naegleria lovaniensis]|uniref:Uncharacterized protein n=1 Tax=Naegleria lovaniensis TaxID=51637 RepID=A0AA88KEV2_NAELO|nr:uncharacterized protein C9374_012014 [Naegleria lovaniensis]KAG2373551.1 hypothetical protein C9374_012014 [Naegleria lovaniensis]